jgi:hypothetical protein
MLGIIIDDDAQHDHMPDYSFTLEGDNVVVRRKDAVVEPAKRPRLSDPMPIRPETLDAARGKAPGWDIYRLESEWRAWVAAKGISVQDPDRHFLSFCHRRGPIR